MEIQLCKKSVDRLGSAAAALLDALREREHTPVLKDCLNRCQACDLGIIIASADGVAMSAKHADKLLGDLDELAAEDL